MPCGRYPQLDICREAVLEFLLARGGSFADVLAEVSCYNSGKPVCSHKPSLGPHGDITLYFRVSKSHIATAAAAPLHESAESGRGSIRALAEPEVMHDDDHE